MNLKKYFLIMSFVVVSNFSEAAPSGYFNQFMMEVHGNCADISSVWFRVADTLDDAYLGLSEDGKSKYASTLIQLFPDLSYWLVYKEYKVVKNRSSTGGMEITWQETTFEKQLSGSWRENNGEIELSKFGFGEPAIRSTKWGTTSNTIKLHITEPLNDDRILKTSMNIGMSITNVGPKGKLREQYCSEK